MAATETTLQRMPSSWRALERRSRAVVAERFAAGAGRAAELRDFIGPLRESAPGAGFQSRR